MSERDSLVLGALLHDIGKLVQRADDQPTRMTHQEFGAEWMREQGIPEIVASIVERHHLLKKADSKYEKLDAGISNLTLTCCQADRLSAIERPEKEVSSDERGEWRFDVPLLSIFGKVSLSPGGDISGYYMEPSPLSPKISYPKTDVKLDKKRYKECLRSFEVDFSHIKNSLTVDNLLVILEKHTSSIPSETRIVEGKIESYPDVSLFDHLKTTTAIAKVIDLYLTENYWEKYKRNELLREEIQNDEDNKFLLVGGDFSGVQKFIYTISSRGALKTLRARSFFLELLTEHVLAEILRELALTRANIIYAGGGRFYVLAPNTNSAKEKLDGMQGKINRWLFEEFKGKLYLAMGRLELSGEDLKSEKISETWSNLSIKIEESKGCRFREQLNDILKPEEPKLPFDTCCVCHRDDIYEDEIGPLHSEDPTNKACSFCRSLFSLGDKLIDVRFIGKTMNEVLAKKHCMFPLKVKAYNDKNVYYVPLKIKDEDFDTLYIINNWDLKNYIASNSVPILIGNYVRKVEDLPPHAQESQMHESTTASFSELAKASRGANRIGALRMDVDNLGRIFTQGFKKEWRTFSRFASLSRQLTLFFKFYINSVCGAQLGENILPLDLSEKSPQDNKGRNLSIIYSGGDDLFLIGAWDEVIEIAFDIYRSFKSYTCNNPDINLSGGVIVQHKDFPLYLLADLTGKAEELAKDAGRNRITLFYNPSIKDRRVGGRSPVKQSFNWEMIDNELLEIMRVFKALGKIRKEQNHFQPRFAHGFLYKLFSLFEEWERMGVMYLPRMGYTYKRIQEALSKEEETVELQTLRAILMDREKITNLRTPLIWVELLTRSGEKIS